MKALAISIALLSAPVFANPIAVTVEPTPTAVVEKTWERCVISAGKEYSTVSCAVGYRGKQLLDAPFYLLVPVIIPETMATDQSKLSLKIKARIEIGGKIHQPVQVQANNPLLPGFAPDPLLPPGTVRAECMFDLGKLPSKSFSVVVSYEQPTIDGKVYYLPQFEGGKNPKDYSEFSVSVFPADGGLLALESKHKVEAISFATRVTVKPVHNEIIKIGYNPSEQAVPPNGP